MSLIDVDPAIWAANTNARPFAVRHELVGHPLLTREAVTELAARLPPQTIDVNRADLDPLHEEEPPPLDRSAREIAQQIETLHQWMALKHIEQDATYRQLVDEILGSVGTRLSLGDAMRSREGYLVLSPGASVTPAHVDHEHNFLLQIRGTKTVTVGSFPDAASEAEIMEGMHDGNYGRTGFAPHEPQVFDLEPGTGVYIPPRAVHLVQNGDQLSVSLSVVFHTSALERAARVYKVNAKLRGLGLHPRPPARSALIDRSKSAVMLAWKALHRDRAR